jgi:hypothetical protein
MHRRGDAADGHRADVDSAPTFDGDIDRCLARKAAAGLYPAAVVNGNPGHVRSNDFNFELISPRALAFVFLDNQPASGSDHHTRAVQTAFEQSHTMCWAMLNDDVSAVVCLNRVERRK